MEVNNSFNNILCFTILLCSRNHDRPVGLMLDYVTDCMNAMTTVTVAIYSLCTSHQNWREWKNFAVHS